MLDISTCEFETKPFTVSELSAVHAYESAVSGSGIRDCFDQFDVDSVRDHETEFGQEAAQDMLREYAGMLNAWHLALDSLLGDILTCTTEVTRYSTAARRYVEAAADDYHRTRQDFEYAVTAWSLALLTGGSDADYPPPTRSVNWPMQSLDTEGA